MSADDGLRQALVSALDDLRIDNSKTDAEIIADIADAVLALPEVAALRAKAAAADRVEALADELDREAVARGIRLDRCIPPGDRIRRALDGPAVQQ